MSPKNLATAQAVAALAGVEATASRDDRGQATLILRRGAWCREVLPSQLASALEELRQLQREGAIL
jgi:hypothetical protein